MKAIADDHQIAGPEGFDKIAKLGEIIAFVRVSHDHEPAFSGAHSASQRVAVAFVGNANNSCTRCKSEISRPICRTVVGDEHLSVNTSLLEKVARLADAGRNGFGLVKAWHEDSQ